jgi:hypothetical protein
LADDQQLADGETILDYWQARDRARLLANGLPASSLKQHLADKAMKFLEQGLEPACYLYRHYHPNGDLLYVGVSLEPLRRQIRHIGEASWWSAVHQILIEPFATREEALAAEELAIRTEFPRFNRSGNRRRHPIQELARIKG